ncbi:hypothetical protein HYPSUDRAFT_53484 [Hypholoma sublateritium FD-334 SS-4]|uniref:Uncharacterized protein n=1 Tax=Hypholoma sublateritium (strain FD-334 SS-4) TaxID=945553 RepID=A0A0D2MM27_HYPSF|nr:hypothetical protein HYPSUDRAFT_53484 [Hypholoma sublateritium FD-334 SS-4]
MFNLLKSLFRSPTKYYLVKRLKGSKGPVNALAFNRDVTLLASGGDDEIVRIWEIATGNVCQQLLDLTGRWGQITCLAFVYHDSSTTALLSECQWIFFGSGRGMFTLYHQMKDTKEFVQILNKQIFAAGDSVESFDYSPRTRQLAVTSHYGHLSLYNFFNGELYLVWSKAFPDYIPRAVRFQQGGINRVVVFGLETGRLTFLDTETALEINSKVFSSAIYLVDNMADGFDLYPPNRTSAIQKFKVATSRKYVKQAVFAEKGKLAVCGSDHGLAYIFDINLSCIPQRLNHGKGDELIQTVESASANGNHFIATGSSGGNFDICLWERFAGSQRRKTRVSGQPTVLTAANVIVLCILCFATLDKWLPPTVQVIRGLVPESEESMNLPWNTEFFGYSSPEQDADDKKALGVPLASR